MADTLTTQSSTLATIPASTVISTDEVGVNGGTTAHVQHVKLVDGASNGTVGVTVGGGVEAAALRVTLANDSTGLVSVDDNGGTLSVDDGAGSLTVDNGGTFAVQAAQSGTWTVQPGNTANTTAWKVDGSAVTQPVSAASLPLPSGAATAAKQPALGTAGASSTDVISVQGIASGTALPVSIASVPSHAVTNAGTFVVQENGAALTALQLIDNIVLAEDAAHASADPGVMSLAVRKATPVNLSGTDGDYEPLQVSAGRLWASATIDAALPAGTNAIGKLAANTGVTIGAVEIAAAQTLATVTTVSTVSTLTGTTSLTPGTAAANLGKAEDAAHTSGDVGVMALAVRQDTPGASAGTDGDYAAIQVDAAGAVRTSRPRSSTSSAIAQTTQGTTAAQVLASNAARKLVMIQNTGTTILKFALGAGTPTATVYHFALAPCVATDDGNGAAWISDAWTGAIQALSSGASGQMVVTELT